EGLGWIAERVDERVIPADPVTDFADDGAPFRGDPVEAAAQSGNRSVGIVGFRATADRCGPVLLLIHQSMQQLAQRSLADLGHSGVAEHEWSVEDRAGNGRAL